MPEQKFKRGDAVKLKSMVVDHYDVNGYVVCTWWARAEVSKELIVPEEEALVLDVEPKI
jgi:uncharacterized protein YodC (DUF2158 family)